LLPSRNDDSAYLSLYSSTDNITLLEDPHLLRLQKLTGIFFSAFENPAFQPCHNRAMILFLENSIDAFQNFICEQLLEGIEFAY
jgi:hypothetical protein